MEVLGAVLGVAGLAGTFSACVDCFGYVRISRQMGPDYETAIIKLDLIRLKFTRWGEAVGIVQDDESLAVSQLKATLDNPDKDFHTIEQALKEIMELFLSSAETSSRIAAKFSEDKLEHIAVDDLEKVPLKKLHETLRKLSISRKRKQTVSQKASWALYKKRHLDGLIEDLNDLVAQLVELAPVKAQKDLCSKELIALSTDENVVILDDVLSQGIGEGKMKEDIDTMLHEQVKETIEQRKGTMTTAVWKRTKVGEGSIIQQGDKIASGYAGDILDRQAHFVVEDSELGKNVKFHQGNSYG